MSLEDWLVILVTHKFRNEFVDFISSCVSVLLIADDGEHVLLLRVVLIRQLDVDIVILADA